MTMKTDVPWTVAATLLSLCFICLVIIGLLDYRITFDPFSIDNKNSSSPTMEVFLEGTIHTDIDPASQGARLEGPVGNRFLTKNIADENTGVCFISAAGGPALNSSIHVREGRYIAKVKLGSERPNEGNFVGYRCIRIKSPK